MLSYKPKGTCCNRIEFDIVDGKINNVSFHGGCNGNLQAIAKLVEGLDAKTVIEKLKDTSCGFRGTSCPDQLAVAIEKELNSSEQQDSSKTVNY